jgi:hypothetical protein
MDEDEFFLLSLSVSCPTCGAPIGEQCRSRRIHARLRDYRIDVVSSEGANELAVLSVAARNASEACSFAVALANRERASGAPWRAFRVVDVDDDTGSLIYFIPPVDYALSGAHGSGDIVEIRLRSPRRSAPRRAKA